MFKQTVRTSNNQQPARKRIKLTRGDTMDLYTEDLHSSKLMAIENRYIDLSASLCNKTSRSKHSSLLNSESKDKNSEFSISTSILSPKITNFNEKSGRQSNSREILELQHKVNNLHLLDLKVQEVTRKANSLINQSIDARKNLFTQKFSTEPQSMISSEEEDQYPEGIYFGELKRCAPEGKGVLKINDLIVFQGRWSKGKYHGEGKETNVSYNILNEAHYIKNIQSKLQKRSIALQNWKYYKGNFYYGKKHNKGVLILPGEFQVHGSFDKNYILGQIQLFNKYNTLVFKQILNKPVLIR